MPKAAKRFLILVSLLLSCVAAAHEHKQEEDDRGTAHYLGNEGVLVSTEHGNVLFDPFFHNNYGQYTLVPEDIRAKIFSGDEPYTDISIILVSHAHGDHFSAEDALRYLKDNEDTKLIGPAQAINKVLAMEGSSEVKSQLRAIRLKVGDPVIEDKLGNITVESVRIPHAGWPGRKDVSNLVYRVTFGEELNVIHMGDADPNDVHFKPYKKHWEESESELAFPPYWFFTSRFGPKILSERVNAVKSIGIHVPTKAPEDLIRAEKEFFSVPGETREFSPKSVE